MMKEKKKSDESSSPADSPSNAVDGDSDDDYFSNPLKRYRQSGSKAKSLLAAPLPSLVEVAKSQKRATKKSKVADSLDDLDIDWLSDNDSPACANENKRRDLLLGDDDSLLEAADLLSRGACSSQGNGGGSSFSQSTSYGTPLKLKGGRKRTSSEISTPTKGQSRLWKKRTSTSHIVPIEKTSKRTTDDDSDIEFDFGDDPTESTEVVKYCNLEIIDMECVQTSNILLRMDHTLEETAEKYAKEWDCDVGSVQLLLTDGLTSIDLKKTAGEIGFVANTPNRVTAMKRLPCKERADCIKVKWLLPDKRPIISYVCKRVTFDVLKREFAINNGLRAENLTLLFDNERVNDKRTPQDLDMENGDCIDVLGSV